MHGFKNCNIFNTCTSCNICNALPMDSVYAQTSDIIPDGEDGGHEGKSCPSKNKTASVSIGLNI